jgi:hypothetical protein
MGAFDIVSSIVGWYEWGIADASLQRMIELFGRLFVCRHIDLAFLAGEYGYSGTIQTSVVLQPEAIGPDGIQGNYPVGYPTPALPEPEWDNPVEIWDYAVAYNDSATSEGKAVLGSVGPLSAGTSQVFNGATTAYIAICSTSTSSGVICYRDSDTLGKAIAFTRSGTVFTFGSEFTFNATATAWISCVALNSTTVVVAYRDSDTLGKAIVLSISGTTITAPGSEATFDAVGPVQGTGITRLSPTLVIVGFSSNGTSAACPLAVSGSTITPGTQQGTTESGDYCSIAALDSQTAILVYASGVAPMRGMPLLSITASTFNLGSSLEIASPTFDDSPGNPLVDRLDSTRFIVTWQEAGGGSNFDTRVVAGQLSGSTLSFGTSLEILVGAGNYTDYPTVLCSRSDGAQAVITAGVAGAVTVNGTSTSVAVSGTVLTDNTDDVIWNSNATDIINIASCAMKTPGS